MEKTNWFLVYTKPQKERIALEQLQRQDYRSYLPLHKISRRIRGKRHCVEEPLFPRYLFVNLNTETDNWSPIRSTIGVSHLVRFGLLTAKVSGDFVEFLQAKEQARLRAVERVERFKKGDAVRIMQGPFAGYEAVFEQNKGTERAIVMLSIVNSFTQLKIEQEFLDKVV